MIDDERTAARARLVDALAEIVRLRLRLGDDPHAPIAGRFIWRMGYSAGQQPGHNFPCGDPKCPNCEQLHTTESLRAVAAKLPAFIRRPIEQAIDRAAVHPKGMSVHDGKIHGLASDKVAYLLRAYDRLAEAAKPSDARIEAAYWEFDARRKGYAPFKNSPQSERDAFKSTVRRLLAGEEAIR